jgi:VCBS repeat-containing protein
VNPQVTVSGDTTAPSVTINQASGQNDPTNTSPVNFTVVFSEPVSNFVTGDVTLSGTAGATTQLVTGSGTTYNVAVSGMIGTGTVIASIAANRATDAAGNQNTASTSTDNTVTYDATTPTVVSINRLDASPTNANSIAWNVTFSESVTGFGAGDIVLPTTGISGSSITLVSPGSTTYTVTTTTGNGSGSIGLNLNDDDSITDAAGNKLGGIGTGVAGGGGAGNGSFTGQVYTIDRTLTPVIVANDKAYDGNTTATLVSCMYTSNLTVTEDVNVACNTPTFDDPNAGTRTVTANVTKTGAAAARYVLSSPTASDAAAITPAGQTINVTTAAPPSAVFGQSFNVAATGGASGNPVVIAGSGACAGGGNGSATITMTSGTGTCVVTYNQAASSNYSAAPQVTSNTTAAPATTTIAITADTPDPSILGQAVAINYTVAANPPGSGMPTGNVTVNSSTGESCVDTVAAGTCSITFNTFGTRNLTATYVPSGSSFVGSSSAAVSHLVIAPPSANNDSYSTTQENLLTVSAPGVLGNDSDADSPVITAVLDVAPANGTVSLNADGSFTYQPNPGYTGPDSFTYHATDGIAISNIVTVSITVNGAVCTAPPANMVAWYPANGNAIDVMGGNNGTLQNGATVGAGRVGQAFQLDGADDYVSAPHVAKP